MSTSQAAVAVLSLAGSVLLSAAMVIIDKRIDGLENRIEGTGFWAWVVVEEIRGISTNRLGRRIDSGTLIWCMECRRI